MAKKIGEYRYACGYYFLSDEKIPKCLDNAYLKTQYRGTKAEMEAFLNAPVDSSELANLKRASTLVEAPNTKQTSSEDALRRYLSDVSDKKEGSVQNFVSPE